MPPRTPLTSSRRSANSWRSEPSTSAARLALSGPSCFCSACARPFFCALGTSLVCIVALPRAYAWTNLQARQCACASTPQSCVHTAHKPQRQRGNLTATQPSKPPNAAPQPGHRRVKMVFRIWRRRCAMVLLPASLGCCCVCISATIFALSCLRRQAM